MGIAASFDVQTEPVSKERDTDAHELLLLSTEQEVHAYDLSRIERIRIGRHKSNELRLSSRTVSNFHAEIINEDGVLVLRDLGSTNGTKLNGQPVEQKGLSTGDRILIGNHLVRLELKARSDAASSGSGLTSLEPWIPGRRGRVVSPYSAGLDKLKTIRVGDYDDVCLVDLILGLAHRPGSSKAVIEHDGARAAIYFHEHNVFHVEYGSSVGEKALYRIFRWQEASYVIEPLTELDNLPCTITLPVETLLSGGTAQALELGKLVARLPPLAARLVLNPDCPLPLTSHTPAEIEIFQAIVRHETIENVLESSPFTDVRILRLVESLLRKRVFEVGAEGSSDSGMEETYHSNLEGKSF
jgi:FHA domain